MDIGSARLRGSVTQTSNSGIDVGAGTTAERPANDAGLIRYNTDLGRLEFSNGAQWANIGTGDFYTVSSNTPTNLGVANNAGTSNSAARVDHVHQFPLAIISNTIINANATLTLNDHGRVVEWNFGNSSLLLPNTFPVGFNCLITVANATGVPTFLANTGTTIRQADGYTKARKQWSEVSVRVHSNANGAAAVYILSGDMV